MNLSDITPVILTLNESANIGRCLERLRWADEVIVLDSGSSDDTRAICDRFPNVKFFYRDFDSHSTQWNHAVSLASTEWVLALDADFLLAPEAAPEFEQLDPDSGTQGYIARFRYCVSGRPLRSSLYPPKTVLFRRENCTYLQDGHTQLLTGDSPSSSLRSMIDHDDRKPLSHWLKAQQRYAILESDKLRHGDRREFALPDRIRCLIWPAAPVVFLYTLLVRRTILDGWPGWFYALQRTYAELLVSLELLNAKLRPDEHTSVSHDVPSITVAPRPRSSRMADRDRASLHD